MLRKKGEIINTEKFWDDTESEADDGEEKGGGGNNL